MKLKAIMMIIVGTVVINSWSADQWVSFYGVGLSQTEQKADQRLIMFSNGITIDTRDSNVVIPHQYQLISEEKRETQPYLVQFSGPVQKSWKESLSSTGARVISYYPNYSYLVQMDERVLKRVKSLSFVAWTGPFKPAYKILHSSLLTSQTRGRGGLVLLLFPDADVEETVKAVELLGGKNITSHKSMYARTVTIGSVDFAQVSSIAALHQVMAVQTKDNRTFTNTDAQWLLQQGWRSGVTRPSATDLTARPVWRRGLTGKGLILGYYDTGINFNIGTPPENGHKLLRDPAVSITKEGEYPDHRKVIAYRVYPGAAFGDEDMLTRFHGTHIGGSIAGNDTIANGTGPDTVDGIAKDARLCFVDICNGQAEIAVPDDVTLLSDLATKSSPAGEIRQHSGSWGTYTDEHVCDYRIIDATHDAWHWDHKLVLAIYAVGNHGLASRTIHHPAVAKNVLSVGACLNGVDAYKSLRPSSRGPTQDNRIKPTIVAPGSEIRSAAGNTIDKYTRLSGTSMATPLVNGAMALVRQYFEEGWYPLGKPRAKNAFYPSSALMRAMAVCSADSGFTLDISTSTNYIAPDSNIGFGRLNLDAVLYFDTLGTDDLNLAVVDYREGIATGKFAEFSVNVKDRTFPLRMALAWIDTAAAVGANPSLVNDLNLEVISPSGVAYRGNQLAMWRSITDPQKWDDRNVEEMIRIVNPETGMWKIRVHGHNMPNGDNVWFGLVMTGSFVNSQNVNSDNIDALNHSASSRVKTQYNSISGKTAINYSLSMPGTVRINLYDCSGKLVKNMLEEHSSAGEKSILWDGFNSDGKKVPCGFYLCEVAMSANGKGLRGVHGFTILK